ncbi:response regulator [Frondihabitans australicus]|uniref:LuxR family two component transcriptional regulator n=1 Tax=Frondihabitans australicus TaxID=386892 RepID=A0A495IBJ8_9MICO|nr:response regulator transcription factor [Frondihabitans australicus]RKR73374.1 LuxR family two component transcriptional regulator [Frondihabitans australicus]
MTISVLIVDDQALVRTGFRFMLQSTPDLVVAGEAADGRQAVAQARALRPDVVLMDVRMPTMDGIEATRRIVAETTSRVLILTTFDLDEYAFEGLGAGASGFLLKDTPPAALYDAVRAVADGDAVLTPRITRDLVTRFAAQSVAPRPRPAEGLPIDGLAADDLAALTPREQDVFRSIAAGLSNAEIAASLFLTEATVKTHITRLLAKLHLRDRVQVVIYACERGLV